MRQAPPCKNAARHTTKAHFPLQRVSDFSIAGSSLCRVVWSPLSITTTQHTHTHLYSPKKNGST